MATFGEIIPQEEVEAQLSQETLRRRKATKAMVRNAYLNAMAEAVTPEEVIGALRRAIEYADGRRDPKAMVMVLELLLNYAIGRPSPFEERDSMDIDKILSVITPDTFRRAAALAAAPFIEDNIHATGESFTLSTQDP